MNEESIFAAAVQKRDAAERQAFLDQACAGDLALRQRIEQLLAADRQTAGILERGPEDVALSTQTAQSGLAVDRVFDNRFKLRQKLGEGGMGEVWVADQTEPMQRRVALKVIRPGLDSARMLARFDQERQALALMDHPNIAKVLDAGVTNNQPYFVMELIKGVSITQYCDQARLPPRQRLEVFIPVCHAVQHAHQKGIIHRDLKPSNILVALYDSQPVPKVIDFGVAKATGPRLTEHTVYTEVGSLIGTLEYMSPEQAELNNLDIDTRSDIYALGAILYELLTGSVPFSRQVLQAAAFTEMLRIIKEVDPPKPSTRLSGSGMLASVAAQRQTEPARLPRLVRGELDWIVMKALEKDRNRRYETPNGLAQDLERYLNEEPVVAGPASTWYRLRKFARRNKTAFTAGFFVLLASVVAVVTGLVIREQGVGQRKAAHAAGLVERLLDADTAQVPGVVAEMTEYRKWTDPLLREEIARAADRSRQKLHASLALLPVDGSLVTYLYNRLLDAEPHEVPVIRDALVVHKDALLEKLWAVALMSETGGGVGRPSPSARLRAAAALAKYDPTREEWAKCSPPVASNLVRENPVSLGHWSEAFRPVKKSLLVPLADIFRDRSSEHASERTLATNLLAEYAADDPQLLADLLMDADDKQFAVIYPKLKEHGERGLIVLTTEIDIRLPADLPSSHPKRESLAKRQANAAVALLRMNQPAKAWPLLKHSPDPRPRSYLIHRLSPLGVDAGAIVKQVDSESDVTILRALVLSLGEYGEMDFTPDARNAVLPKLQTLYRTASDPGLHAACEWLLRRWKQEAWLTQVNEEWAKGTVAGGAWRVEGKGKLVPPPTTRHPSPGWYVNTQGQTMVVIAGPVEFVMGSPPTEAGRGASETQHKRRIGRTFALSAKLVTLAEYRNFKPRYGIDQNPHTAGWVLTTDSPVMGPSWFQAVHYCNWLSKREGLPESEWCYEPFQDPKAWPLLAVSSVGLLSSPGGQGALVALGGMYPGRTDARYAGGMRLARNYLQRQGYRLPTEAEMEYATRAGAVTARYYGETDELLSKYAWYLQNAQERTWPVGSLKPNDLGLFDAHGNVFTLCQDRLRKYPQGNEVTDDTEDDLAVELTNRRVWRGGNLNCHPSMVRSAFRMPGEMSIEGDGFRLARTLPPGSFPALPSTAD